MQGEPSSRHPGLWLAALFGVVAMYAWASRQFLVVLLVPNGDTWAHLAAIRRTLELGPFPGDLFYGGGATPPYYSLAHLLFAGLARLSGRAPHDIFVAAPPLIAALDLTSSFLFLRLFTGDIRLAVIGTAVDLLLHVPGQSWAALSYPSAIAVAPRYLCWYAYVRGRPRRSVPWLIAAGFGLGACIATHLYGGGLCLIGLFLLDLALVPGRRRAVAPLFLTLALGLVLASPWLGNIIQASAERPAQTLAVFRLARRSWDFSLAGVPLAIMEPQLLFETLGAPSWIPVLVGLGLCLQRARQRQASAADRYALFAVATAAVLLFTPLYGFAVLALGVWTPRLVLVVPYSLLFGLGVVGTTDWLRTTAVSPPRRRALQLASLCVCGWIAFAAAREVYKPVAEGGAYGRGLAASGPLETWDLERRLAQFGPLPEVVLSDPDTSYLLPYLLGSYVVTMPAAHGSPYADHAQRLKDVRRFFTPGTSERERREIIDSRGADAVAINLRSSWPQDGANEALLRQLRENPAFVDTGCCGSVVFLRYRR